jgi:hypothetical protein
MSQRNVYKVGLYFILLTSTVKHADKEEDSLVPLTLWRQTSITLCSFPKMLSIISTMHVRYKHQEIQTDSLGQNQRYLGHSRL